VKGGREEGRSRPTREGKILNNGQELVSKLAIRTRTEKVWDLSKDLKREGKGKETRKQRGKE